ncbi:MAG: hypothetical protein ABSC08_10335 [Bryobacteraceae bacterium]
MDSVVCTLFERDYHYGVGALVNSLCQHGFRGKVYAGYRGDLPPWATAARRESRYSELTVAPQLVLRFVPLPTQAHFTNHKPDFMLSLWDDYCPKAGALFYFDPDILVECRWSFFEEWIRFGVAVCADINPLLSADHPLRHAWREYFEPHGVRFIQQQSTAFNGGFAGVSRQHRNFLKTWQRLQQLMEPAVGGLQNRDLRDRTFLFHLTDQDALNAATMACEEPVSSAGLEGMDFVHGGGFCIMTHAGGGVKPWKKKMLWSALRAIPPRRSDKAFLRYAKSPIQLYSPMRLGLKKLDLLAGSALGRYIHV